jgi:hypothetical protein
MPLPRLPNRSFAHHCPHCGAARVNPGLWFYSIGGYKCEGCGNAIKLTYEDKIKLLNGSGVQTGARGLIPKTEGGYGGREMEGRAETSEGESWSQPPRKTL